MAETETKKRTGLGALADAGDAEGAHDDNRDEHDHEFRREDINADRRSDNRGEHCGVDARAAILAD